MVRLFRFPIVALGILVPSEALLAQNVRQEIRNLLHFGQCTELLCLTLPGGHSTHFLQSATDVAEIVTAFLGNAITTSVGNIPLGSTSSGMTLAFTPTGPVATSQSTGPIFGERSQTLGRRGALVGMNVTGNAFQSIRGRSLSDLRTILTHVDVAPISGLGDPPFERDSIQVRTDLSASAQVFVAFVGYGLSNRLDIGLAVPLVRVSVDGLSVGTIYNQPGTSTHLWERTNTTVDTARASSSASGIGDISLRAKFNLTQSQRGGTGMMFDVRVPTGREEDLLGSGSASVRAIFIASARFNELAPHVNLGYLYRAGERENSAVLGTFGFDALLRPTLTVAADLLGQWQTGASKIPLAAPVSFIDGGVLTSVQRTNIPDVRDNLLGASIGSKLTMGQEMTAVGNLLFPLANGGVKSTVVWTIGLERNF